MSSTWYLITPEQAAIIKNHRQSADGWTQAESFTKGYHLIDPPETGASGVRQLFEDSKTLQGDEWLDDGVMNHYMDLITASRPGSVLSFGSHFIDHCQIVDEEKKIGALRRLEKSPFDYEIWLWPVFVNGNHWCSVAAYPSEKVVVYYDSMIGSDKQARDHCLLVIQWAEMVWRHEGRQGGFAGENWQLVRILNGPKQPNFDDCGVYACQALFELSRGLPGYYLARDWSFGQANMQHLRDIMLEELATRTLRVRD